jgi:hypothetical protein
VHHTTNPGPAGSQPVFEEELGKLFFFEPEGTPIGNSTAAKSSKAGGNYSHVEDDNVCAEGWWRGEKFSFCAAIHPR